MRRAFYLAVLTLALLVTSIRPDAAERARALAPLIEEETFALVRIDATRVDVDGLLKIVLPALPDFKEELTDDARQWKEFLQAFTRAGGTELILSFSTADLPSRPIVHIPLKEGADVPALTALLKKRLSDDDTIQRQGSALRIGSRRALARLARNAPSARPELTAAVTAAADTAIQILLLPSADQRRVTEEVVIPSEYGVSGKTLVRGARWAALGLDVGAKPTARLTVQSADAGAAKKMTDLVALGLTQAGKIRLVGETKPLAELYSTELATATRALAPKVAGSQLTAQLSDPNAVRALAVLTAVVYERYGSLRSVDARNFKQILLALHTYHDTHGTFPPPRHLLEGWQTTPELASGHPAIPRRGRRLVQGVQTG
jgi:hypothetical protein